MPIRKGRIMSFIVFSSVVVDRGKTTRGQADPRRKGERVSDRTVVPFSYCLGPPQDEKGVCDQDEKGSKTKRGKRVRLDTGPLLVLTTGPLLVLVHRKTRRGFVVKTRRGEGEAKTKRGKRV